MAGEGSDSIVYGLRLTLDEVEALPPAQDKRRRLVEGNSLMNQRVAERHFDRVVDGKHMNGYPADRRPAPEVGALPAEVKRPAVPSRMKEPHQLLRDRIDTRDVRALGRIAIKAGKGQVALNRLAAVLHGDDVVNLKGDGTGRLRQVAVFAAVPGTFANQPPKLVIPRGGRAA
jgi:hypothetical protein